MFSFTPAAEGHGLCPWMNAPAFGRDVAPLGREEGCHGLCPWGSTFYYRLLLQNTALLRQDSCNSTAKDPCFSYTQCPSLFHRVPDLECTHPTAMLLQSLYKLPKLLCCSHQNYREANELPEGIFEFRKCQSH